MTQLSTAKRLADYLPPDFSIDAIELTFELHPTQTRVTAVSQVRAITTSRSLVLAGQHLKLLSVEVNNQPWTEYQLEPDQLKLDALPAQFELKIVTEIAPKENLALEGLYQSNGAYCTQCEAEGFRRITYYLDRPDVMAVFTTHIIANPAEYPYMLGNGNLVARQQRDDGLMHVTWHDPFPKPCYLFALVAGHFDEVVDSFVTRSGRHVAIKFYVDVGHAAQASFAVEALKRAMAFDEEVYGREYDLDIYMVVAVDFFNMGAMENKGLNIFNSKYVLADNSTATDTDFFNVESIIGHEYFHNWTGNRVTCRDWFQLSLKEGLTVFRDQQFSAAMGSPTLCRIDAVKTIRTAQFEEDAGPMAHPIRPELVLEMNNFYTVTVYDKGAEVIRMMHTLLGDAGFRRGMDLYFDRHDGQAVTCDDFVAAMADANRVDLSQFKRWYSQAGTPFVTVQFSQPASNRAELTLHQVTPATADGSAKLPFVIPVRYELLSADGELQQHGILEFNEQEQHFTFEGLSPSTVPVLFADFSAPVKFEFSYSIDQLILIAKSSHDGVARWDAMQTLWSNIIRQQLGATDIKLPDALVSVYRDWLIHSAGDLAFIAELLSIPTYYVLAGQYQPVPVEALLATRSACVAAVAAALHTELTACYTQLQPEAYAYQPKQIGMRQLRNCCLEYLAVSEANLDIVTTHYRQADNMTDRIAALKVIATNPSMAKGTHLLSEFYQDFGENPQLFDKLSALIVSIPTPEVYQFMTEQVARPQFDWTNPNRVRAVYLAFSQANPWQFHAADGRGYQTLCDVICKLDSQNPQLTARLVTPLLSWRNYDEARQQQMRAQLLTLTQLPSISSDLFEKVQRSL